jgi:hypothetical protein
MMCMAQVSASRLNPERSRLEVDGLLEVLPLRPAPVPQQQGGYLRDEPRKDAVEHRGPCRIAMDPQKTHDWLFPGLAREK